MRTTVISAPPLFSETVLRAAVAHIEATPDHWSQGSFLGTNEHGLTMCLAGWIAHLSGLDVYLCLRRDNSGRELVGHVRTLLGLDARAAQLLFWNFGTGAVHHPSVAMLKRRLTEILGVTFDDVPPEMTASVGSRLRDSLATGGFRIGHQKSCTARFDPDTSGWTSCTCPGTPNTSGREQVSQA